MREMEKNSENGSNSLAKTDKKRYYRSNKNKVAVDR